MKNQNEINQILQWIEQQQKVVEPTKKQEHSTFSVRLKTDTEKEACFIRELLLKLLPGMSLNSPRKGTNPRYTEQKWFLYGDIKVTDCGAQIRRRRRSDVGKKRGEK